MELYYSSGGAQNPRFAHSVRTKTVSAEAYQWLQEYEGLEYFDRFYINWVEQEKKGYLEVQFERKEPAMMFLLTWGGGVSLNLKERIVDWYLTRKTGKTKAEREYLAWYERNINVRATRIKDIFRNFKHVVIVDPSKFFDLDEPFGWVVCEEAKQYFWPNKSLGDNAVWRFERVINCPATAWEWEINELGGADKVFVATNNAEDAFMLKLAYS